MFIKYKHYINTSKLEHYLLKKYCRYRLTSALTYALGKVYAFYIHFGFRCILHW